MPDVPPPPPSPPDIAHEETNTGVSRRSFLQTLGVSAAASALSARAVADPAPNPQSDAEDIDIIGPGPAPITLTINGDAVTLSVEPATTLLEALRSHLHMTGTKEACDRGSCGACSVLIDGALTTSCMMLAVNAVGKQITTIEGLAKNGELHPVQEAFIKHDALQCGYCTPGLVLASVALLNENPEPTLEEIQHGLSGNLCRCGTYTNIFNAVLDASGQSPIIDGGGVNHG